MRRGRINRRGQHGLYRTIVATSTSLYAGTHLDELRVDLGLGNDGLQDVSEHLFGTALCETTLLGLGDGCSKGRDDDDWEGEKSKMIRRGKKSARDAASAMGRQELLTIIVVLGEKSLLSLLCHGGCTGID